MNINTMLSEREAVHGEYMFHSKLSQELKNAVRRHDGFCALNNSQRESIDMILHKIARVVNSRIDHADNWIDICGYAQLIVNQLDQPRFK